VSNLLIISSDCHAGALPATYSEYLPAKYRDAADAWWLAFAREMVSRAGTFFDQEAVEDYAEKAGDEGITRLRLAGDRIGSKGDEALRAMLSDENSAFAPRRGEWDPEVRLRELEEDGVAGEVIFPQMAPFGAGLMQYRAPIDPDQNLEGNRAYNRFLADLCKAHPGRHAGVALVNLDDIEVTVREVRDAKEMGLWGGVLLPTSTGDHPFYHHPRYEPLWRVCEEIGMPVHSHSGWSPDYGDVPAATAMYISEVDMWAHRPFAALVWSGVFERHPQPGALASPDRVLPAAVPPGSVLPAGPRGGRPPPHRHRQADVGLGLPAPRGNLAEHDGRPAPDLREDARARDPEDPRHQCGCHLRLRPGPADADR
jgi:hypothetical protein